MNKAIIFVLVAECWITIGQICFKKSANQKKGTGTIAFNYLLGNCTCPLFLGAAAMLAGMLFWFAALSAGDLSFVYLLGSIQYIFVLFAAHFFLQEKINTTKLLGTLLITLGIILTAIS